MTTPSSDPAGIRIEPVTLPTRMLSFHTLAAAFRSDPVMRWLQPHGWADPLFFAGTWINLRKDLQVADIALEGRHVVGAAYWEKPGSRTSRLGEALAAPFFIAALRTGTGRGEILAEMLHEHRPRRPHWYLSTVGATRPHRGIGSALLHRGLDRTSGPVYLESSNPKNIPLYQRYGFEPLSKIDLPNGPTLVTMAREGR